MLYGTHGFLDLRGNQSTTVISRFLDPDPNHLLKKKNRTIKEMKHWLVWGEIKELLLF